MHLHVSNSAMKWTLREKYRFCCKNTNNTIMNGMFSCKQVGYFLSEVHCNNICIYEICQSLACIDLRDIYSEMKILIWYLVNYITRSSEESIGSDIHVITRTRNWMNSSVRLLEYIQTAAHLRWVGTYGNKSMFTKIREKKNYSWM